MRRWPVVPPCGSAPWWHSRRRHAIGQRLRVEAGLNRPSRQRRLWRRSRGFLSRVGRPCGCALGQGSLVDRLVEQSADRGCDCVTVRVRVWLRQLNQRPIVLVASAPPQPQPSRFSSPTRTLRNQCTHLHSEESKTLCRPPPPIPTPLPVSCRPMSRQRPITAAQAEPPERRRCSAPQARPRGKPTSPLTRRWHGRPRQGQPLPMPGQAEQTSLAQQLR